MKVHRTRVKVNIESDVENSTPVIGQCVNHLNIVLADLGDVGGPVPDHHKKLNITIKGVTCYFKFPSAYACTVL